MEAIISGTNVQSATLKTDWLPIMITAHVLSQAKSKNQVPSLQFFSGIQVLCCSTFKVRSPKLAKCCAEEPVNIFRGNFAISLVINTHNFFENMYQELNYVIETLLEISENHQLGQSSIDVNRDSFSSSGKYMKIHK